MARKPQIKPASDGNAFASVIPDAPAPHQQRAEPRAVPAEGDAAYQRIVQTNYGIPAGVRAKLRALRDTTGAMQNEVVAKAIEDYFRDYEKKNGPVAVEQRHFR